MEVPKTKRSFSDTYVNKGCYLLMYPLPYSFISKANCWITRQKKNICSHLFQLPIITGVPIFFCKRRYISGNVASKNMFLKYNNVVKRKIFGQQIKYRETGSWLFKITFFDWSKLLEELNHFLRMRTVLVFNGKIGFESWRVQSELTLSVTLSDPKFICKQYIYRSFGRRQNLAASWVNSIERVGFWALVDVVTNIEY